MCWSLWVVSFGAYSSRFVSAGATDSNASIIEKSTEDNAMNTMNINKGNLSGRNRKHFSALKEKTSNNDLKNTSEKNSRNKFRNDFRSDFQLNLCVSDAEQVWSGTTEINLFDCSYINDQENESVRSEDQQNVIAPGTQNQYLFRVTNQGTRPIRYQIWYETEEKASGMDLPIESEMERLSVDEAGTGTEKEAADSKIETDRKRELLLQPETSDQYRFQWKWLYERDDDLYDTWLGNQAVDQELKYIVKIHIRAELDFQEQLQGGTTQNRKKQSSQEQSEERMKTGSKTGDAADWRYWCMVCAISLMFSILLYGGLKWIGYGTATVMSGSMEPKLKVGDLVILEPVNRRDSLKKGDIIVYRSGNRRIVHRLISVSKSTLRVKGDANNREDQPIRFQQVEGKVICRIPKAGKLFSGYCKSMGAASGEKEIYGAFYNWSGQKEQATVAGFDLQVEGDKDPCLTIENQDGTGMVNYSFTVTNHSQVDVKYQIILELEDGAELPDGVSYEITPEQGWIQAGDNTPKEHTVLFYFRPISVDHGEPEENQNDEEEVNLAGEYQGKDNDVKQSEEGQCEMADEGLSEELSGWENEENESETMQIQEDQKGETEDAMKEIRNVIIEHIKIRMVAEQAE